jgi:hypothetical protein
MVMSFSRAAYKIISMFSKRSWRIKDAYLRNQRLLGAWLGVVTILAFPEFCRDGRSANGESSETESDPHIDKAVLSQVVEMVEASCGCIFHLVCGVQTLYMSAAPIARSCVCNHVQIL